MNRRRWGKARMFYVFDDSGKIKINKEEDV